MSRARPIATPLPPHLSMDEYVDFVDASIRQANQDFATRQKNIEKRILKPFRISNQAALPYGLKS